MSAKGKTDNGAGKKGGQGIYIVVIAMMVVILGLVAAIIMIAKNSQSQEETTTVRRNVVVNKDNLDDAVKEIIEHGNDFVAPGNYEVIMNSTWYFKSGRDASSNAYVENSIGNTNDVYFDVMLADTKETIYESPIIPRGAYLNEITLDKKLDAGTYDCVLVYHLIDDKQNTVSTLSMTLVIVVEE